MKKFDLQCAAFTFAVDTVAAAGQAEVDAATVTKAKALNLDAKEYEDFKKLAGNHRAALRQARAQDARPEKPTPAAKP